MWNTATMPGRVCIARSQPSSSQTWPYSSRMGHPTEQVVVLRMVATNSPTMAPLCMRMLAMRVNSKHPWASPPCRRRLVCPWPPRSRQFCFEATQVASICNNTTLFVCSTTDGFFGAQEHEKLNTKYADDDDDFQPMARGADASPSHKRVQKKRRVDLDPAIAKPLLQLLSYSSPKYKDMSARIIAFGKDSGKKLKDDQTRKGRLQVVKVCQAKSCPFVIVAQKNKKQSQQSFQVNDANHRHENL